MKDETLGHRIKTLRKAKDLSQEKFAEKAELSQQHISRIENGLTYPGVATLTKIAKALNIPLDDLVETDIKDREDRYTFDILRKLEFLGIEDKLKVSGCIERILDENGIQCIKVNNRKTYNRPYGLFFALSRYHMKGGTKMAVAEVQYQVYLFRTYAIAVMLALHRWQTT